jgi:hypothetical protein
MLNSSLLRLCVHTTTCRGWRAVCEERAQVADVRVAQSQGCWSWGGKAASGTAATARQLVIARRRPFIYICRHALGTSIVEFAAVPCGGAYRSFPTWQQFRLILTVSTVAGPTGHVVREPLPATRVRQRGGPKPANAKVPDLNARVIAPGRGPNTGHKGLMPYVTMASLVAQGRLKVHVVVDV